MRRVAGVLLTALSASAVTLGLAPGADGAATAPVDTTHVTKGMSASPTLGIKHVFVIVLENESYDDTYVSGPDTYLRGTLEKQGTLLRQYYATGHESNDNYVAMVSGQAPNADTSGDCQFYSDFDGSTADATLDSNGQAIGVGCVYPSNVKTIADQLTSAHVSWRGWAEDMGNTKGRESATCGEPGGMQPGTVPTPSDQDGTQTATATDQYAARHNPFVYFHSLLDSGQCAKNVLPLSGLPAALKSAAATPEFNYVIPNLCDDGHDAPCKGKDSTGSNAGGLTSADHFLKTWVPRIEAAPAFRENGLLVITSDESASSDASSCCGEQPGPSDPLPGVVPNSSGGTSGGGLIGTLVIGRDVRANAVDDQPYNHYSLLRSLEDLYGVTTGGTDGKGHLGFAAASGLRPFGPDVFAAQPTTATSTGRGGTHGATGSVGSSSRSLASTGGLPLAGAAAALLIGVLALTTAVRQLRHRAPS